LGWKYSRRQKDLNFNEFNSKDIFALVNEEKMKDIINEIVNDALEDIKEVKRLWNNEKY